MDEYEIVAKLGMPIVTFVTTKLLKKYQNKQELEDELSNVLQILGVSIDVKGFATFMANNGYVTISDSNIRTKDGFEIGSKKGGSSFENSSIMDDSGTGIIVSGEGTGIVTSGDASIKTTKDGTEFTAG